MSVGLVELLFNTAWQEYHGVGIYNGSLVLQNNTDVLNAVSGPRYLRFDRGLLDEFLIYTHSGASVDIDRCVVVRADRFAATTLRFQFWTSYSSTSVFDDVALTTNDLIGRLNKDYVYVTDATALSLSEDGDAVTGCQAVGMQFSGATAKMNQVYFSKAIKFDQVVERSIALSPVPRLTRIKANKIAYEITHNLNIGFHQVPGSVLETIEENYFIRQEPFFLYNDGGEIFKKKLLHCVQIAAPESYQYDDGYQVGLQLGILKEYDND